MPGGTSRCGETRYQRSQAYPGVRPRRGVNGPRRAPIPPALPGVAVLDKRERPKRCMWRGIRERRPGGIGALSFPLDVDLMIDACEAYALWKAVLAMPLEAEEVAIFSDSAATLVGLVKFSRDPNA